jgi:hypothetical protein
MANAQTIQPPLFMTSLLMRDYHHLGSPPAISRAAGEYLSTWSGY